MTKHISSMWPNVLELNKHSKFNTILLALFKYKGKENTKTIGRKPIASFLEGSGISVKLEQRYLTSVCCF